MEALVLAEKWLTRILEWVLIALFFGFFAMVVILVTLRYVFGTTIIGGNEGVTIAFVFTTAIGGAVAIARREHIAITFFIDQLPIAAKRVIYIVGLLLVALINAVMIKYSIDWISAAGRVAWQPFTMPQGYVHAAVPLGCGLAIAYCLVKIAMVMTGRESVQTVWMPED